MEVVTGIVIVLALICAFLLYAWRSTHQREMERIKDLSALGNAHRYLKDRYDKMLDNRNLYGNQRFDEGVLQGRSEAQTEILAEKGDYIVWSSPSPLKVATSVATTSGNDWVDKEIGKLIERSSVEYLGAMHADGRGIRTHPEMTLVSEEVEGGITQIRIDIAAMTLPYYTIPSPEARREAMAMFPAKEWPEAVLRQEDWSDNLDPDTVDAGTRTATQED